MEKIEKTTITQTQNNMKKSLLLFFSLLLAANICAQTPAQKSAGSYSGILYVSLDDPITDETEPLPEMDDEGNVVYDGEGNQVNMTFNVIIESQSDNAVKFGLYNFGFMGLELGDIVLNEVPVIEQTDGSVKFGENQPVFFSFLDGMIEATAKINEDNSYIKNDYAYIDVDVVWTNGDNTPIFVRFVGNDAVKTGISSVNVTALSSAKSFDLQGRRIENAKSGIIIKNGQKKIQK